MNSLFFSSQNKTRILTETFALRQRVKGGWPEQLSQNKRLTA
jgi:hypothetical protein